MKEITIFRVRKSFKDIKSQKGAFLIFETAVKIAKKHGLNVYNNEGKLVYKAAKKKPVDSIRSL